MAGSFSVHSSDLHTSGSTLQEFGQQLTNGGSKLESVGQGLLSHVSKDKSGVGDAIKKVLGKSTEIAGDVFSQAGRVSTQAGKRLHANASAYEETESSVTKGFKHIDSPTTKAPATKASGAGGKSGGDSSGGGNSTGGPSPHKPPTIKGSNKDPHQNSTPSAQTCTGGDPIDVATGRVIRYDEDAELAGALRLILGRTHRSDYRLGRWFGASWASTVDQRLEIEVDGVQMAVDDGRLLSFPTPLDDRPVLPVAGARWLLHREPGGRYRVIDPATELAYDFAPLGDPNHLPLMAIVDGDGNRVDLDYDDRGLLTGLRHSGGYRVAVDTVDGLITALRLLGEGDEPDTVLATYGYDAGRRLVEVVNSGGGSKRFRYDAEGRILRWEDDDGEWYSFGYDAEGRCVRGEGAGGYLNVIMSYDRENLVTSVTNSLGHTTRYRLNDHYQVAAEIDPLGNATSYEWDAADQLLARTDPLGNTTRYDHDDAGNVTAVTWPDGTRTVAAYNERGRRVSMVAEDGGVWRFEYDGIGKLVREIDPLGAITSYAHDERGNITAIADALGGATRLQHNAAGLPVVVTDPLGATTRYEYDRFGRVSTITDPLGGVTRMSWTASGELRERIEPDGTTTRWTYDGNDHNTETVDANGNVTRTEFGGLDLLAAEVGADGGRLSYGYDTELRLVSITNERGLVWRYEYDAAGNLVTETDYNGRELRYEYNAAGQLIKQITGTGDTISFERNPLGRIVRRTSGTGVATFGYDPVGRMVLARNEDAEVVLAYDHAGQKTSESINGRVLRFEHDPLGRPTKLVRPSGAESSWEFDAASNPLALHAAGRTLWFDYDIAGRPVRRELGRLAMRQTWSANHRLTAHLLSAGDRPLRRRDYRYQPDGSLGSINDTWSGSRVFTLDSEGRVQAVQGERWQERYAYDPAGSITFADWPLAARGTAMGPRQYDGTLLVSAGDLTYRHDGSGRTVARQRRGANGQPETWQFLWNADDRLVGVTTPGGVRWRYRYDALGRRIAKERLDGAGKTVERIDFTWDGGQLVEQAHGGAGRRPFAVAWDWEPGGDAPVSQREWPLDQATTQQQVNERFLAIVTDLVGSPTDLVDEAGTVAWHGETSLWGAMVSQSGSAYTPLRFPGQYHDSETGLHYNLYRYYDPETGRYLSHDPLGLDPAPDSFAYVTNPTGWIDPLGLTKRKQCATGPSGPGSGSGRPAKKQKPGPNVRPVPPTVRRKPGAPPNGTYGDRTQEQKRLADAFEDVNKNPKKVSGTTHNSEHAAGYDVLVHKWKEAGLATGRRGGTEEKWVEDNAPAYMEQTSMHVPHDGTGTQFSGGKQGNARPAFGQYDENGNVLRGDDYKNNFRDSQFNAMTDTAEGGKNQISNMVQLNQLGYAHLQDAQGNHSYQKSFGDNDKSADALETRQTDDSYDHMLANMRDRGEGVAYGDVISDGKGGYTKGISYTEPADAHSLAEMELAHKAARTGQWPTQAEIDTTLAKYGVQPKDNSSDSGGDPMDTD